MEPNENIDPEKQNQLKLQQTYFQLTTEDYENIWFRIKEKVGKWLLNIILIGLAIFSGIFGFGLYNLYSYGKNTMNERISAYIKTQEFKNQVTQTFQNQFDEMSQKLKLVDNGLEQLAIYNSAPCKVTDYGYTIVDSTGKFLVVEFGNGKTSEKIVFKSQFSEPPEVIAAIKSNSIVDYPLHISNITTESMVVHAQMMNVNFSWIALGR